MTFGESVKRLVNRKAGIKRLLAPALYPRRVFLRHWMRRSIVEQNIGRLFAQPPIIQVCEFDGAFAINPTSHILFRLIQHGEYEPVLAALARLIIDPSRDVIDVGANVGFYSVLAAKSTSGRVLAVEPAAGVLGLLRENVERNRVDGRVNFFEGVAAASDGTLELSVIAGKEEYSSIGDIKHPAALGDDVKVVKVNGKTLDSLVSQHGLDVGFIKVDAEGSERDVISGSCSVLLKQRPFVLSEFSPALMLEKRIDPASLIELFLDVGYRVIDPIAPNWRVGSRAYGDLFAVPEEKLSEREVLQLLEESRLRGSLRGR